MSPLDRATSRGHHWNMFRRNRKKKAAAAEAEKLQAAHVGAAHASAQQALVTHMEKHRKRCEEMLAENHQARPHHS